MLDLSLPWPAVPFTVIDTESTGLGADARIVEIAAVRFEGLREVARFSSLVNPGCPIPEAATAVHGITDGMVQDAPQLNDLAIDLLHVADDSVPCAYNAPYDRGLLHREGLPMLCPAFDPAHSWIDVFVMIARLDKYASGPGRHKLYQACRRWGVPHLSAHRAYGDAKATGQLLVRLFDANRIRPVSARQLLEHTDRMREHQQIEHNRFRAHCEARANRQALQQELSGLFEDDRRGYEIKGVATDGSA